jgi:hypothetical protein
MEGDLVSAWCLGKVSTATLSTTSPLPQRGRALWRNALEVLYATEPGLHQIRKPASLLFKMDCSIIFKYTFKMSKWVQPRVIHTMLQSAADHMHDGGPTTVQLN